MLTMTGCNKDDSAYKKQCEDAEYAVYVAYLDKDYERILVLSDSFKTAGLFSEGKACYWQGYACDRMMQKRMAELYWKTGLATVENSTEDEDVRVYAGIANRLTVMNCMWGDYEDALKVAVPAVERLKKMGRDTTPEYNNMLIYMACCQNRYGLSEEQTDKLLEKAYHSHLDIIMKHTNATSYRDAIVGVINICYNFLEIQDYEHALFWIDRFGDLLVEYQQQEDARSDYADKQQARYYIYRASALEGLGRKEEASEAYNSFLQTEFSQTGEGKMLGGEYLCIAGLWQESADNFSNLNTLMKEQNVGYSLENIQKMLLKKFEVNRRAGRIDSAKVISLDIVEHLDSAITQSRRANAVEQEAVRQKELEMAADRELMLYHRQLNRLIGMAIFIVALMIYIFVRHRVQRRLKKTHDELRVAHDELKGAYDQLEETTTVKERMESELRIARNIQMSMVPSVFPDMEGLDMYASMTPAKEVGGDLYNYLHNNDKLYFCIGDVSGKGVPASLFMAETTRLFRTLASQGMTPAEIANHMNAELAENNEQGMFVTMFICRYDLKQRRIEYCNAGHNPPVIGNAKGQFAFLDVKETNAPIGLWPDLEYVGEEMELPSGSMMLFYTDGLNEAENRRQEQYGEERIIQLMTSHASQSMRDMVETLKADTDLFRDGAEPNDDLTLFAFRCN